MGSWTPHSRALHNDCALQRDGGFLYGSREWPGQHVCNGKTLLKASVQVPFMAVLPTGAAYCYRCCRSSVAALTFYNYIKAEYSTEICCF